jgi:zinc protease
MRFSPRSLLIVALVLTCIPLLFAEAKHGTSQSSSSFSVPVEYYKLPNGLRVVLSTDHSAPTVVVGVYYRIGFRVEPQDRTGFENSRSDRSL